MKYLFFILILGCNAWIKAQTTLTFEPRFKGKALVLTDYETELSQDSIQIETFKCYISSIKLMQKDSIVFVQKESYHLLDAENKNSLEISLESLNKVEFDSIQFNIGIDSLTSVSGVYGGALDPTKGMYWTWQSGYINFKLEGIAADCPARHHRFQYHIGGYEPPFCAMRKKVLAVNAADNIKIQIDLDSFIKQIDLSQEYEVMSPNTSAMSLADLVASIFYIQNEN